MEVVRALVAAGANLEAARTDGLGLRYYSIKKRFEDDERSKSRVALKTDGIGF